MVEAKRMLRRASEIFEIPVDDLIGEKRYRPIVQARQATASYIRTHTSLSLPDIGRILGDRDHTTILHAIRRASTNPEIKELVQELEHHVESPSSKSRLPHGLPYSSLFRHTPTNGLISQA